MKRVKFNVVNLSDQKITRNEMKYVSGGYASEVWCLCVVGTQWGERAICVTDESECAPYGSIRYYSCDPDATHNGIGC